MQSNFATRNSAFDATNICAKRVRRDADKRTSERCRGPRPPRKTTAKSQYGCQSRNSSSTCLVEQLDAANLVGDLLGQNGVAGWALDLDFSVRHDCGIGGGEGKRVMAGLGVVGGALASRNSNVGALSLGA